MKNIQVFQKGDETCEIDGELVSICHKSGWTIVKWREPGFKEVWENHFPDWNIDMVRISND